MRFGDRVRMLRRIAQSDSTRASATDGSQQFRTSQVENERLHFGDYPSEKFIHKLAHELQADEDELLLLTERVPASLKKRIFERPEAFQQFAHLSDSEMDSLLTSPK